MATNSRPSFTLRSRDVRPGSLVLALLIPRQHLPFQPRAALDGSRGTCHIRSQGIDVPGHSSTLGSSLSPASHRPVEQGKHTWCSQALHLSGAIATASRFDSPGVFEAPPFPQQAPPCKQREPHVEWRQYTVPLLPAASTPRSETLAPLGPHAAGAAGQPHGLVFSIRKCAIGDRAYGPRRSESQAFR